MFGRKFTILTDHQPLKGLHGEGRAVPPLVAAKIQRWALTLSAYYYKLAYKRFSRHCNADTLSRVPLKEEPSHVPIQGDLTLLMYYLGDRSVIRHKFRK